MVTKLTNPDFKSVSDAISEPLIKAYRAGGLVLTVLTLGAILMLTAFFCERTGPIRYIVLIIGAILTFFTLAYVYLKEFPRVRRARASVNANKEMIDAIQQSAIELTELAIDLQSLALKNAEQIAGALELVLPVIRGIPFVGQIADSEVVVKAEGLSHLIVTSTRNARKLISDLQRSLIEANAQYLKVHLEDLKRYKNEVNQLLIGKN